MGGVLSKYRNPRKRGAARRAEHREPASSPPKPAAATRNAARHRRELALLPRGKQGLDVLRRIMGAYSLPGNQGSAATYRTLAGLCKAGQQQRGRSYRRDPCFRGFEVVTKR